MALNRTVKQSSFESLIYPIDWSLSLLTGVDITGVNITHTPPSGDPVVFGSEIASPISYVKSPSGLVVGSHTVSIVAVTTNPDLEPEVFLSIQVER